MISHHVNIALCNPTCIHAVSICTLANSQVSWLRVLCLQASEQMVVVAKDHESEFSAHMACTRDCNAIECIDVTCKVCKCRVARTTSFSRHQANLLFSFCLLMKPVLDIFHHST